MKKIQTLVFLGIVAVLFFGMGVFYSMSVHAAPPAKKKKTSSRVVYPKRSSVDFSGMSIQGEVRNPGEFYFQRPRDEKFDSLVKRRKNFQQEMLRDVVLTK